MYEIFSKQAREKELERRRRVEGDFSNFLSDQLFFLFILLGLQGQKRNLGKQEKRVNKIETVGSEAPIRR